MANATISDHAASSMTLADWLDDLTVRFLLNLPQDELSNMPRLCFQAEEAQWYYEDFIRPAHPNLPSLNLRQFCLTLFKHCPLFNGFSEDLHQAAYEEFLAYKVRVPVRGAILLDENMEKVLLVRGWKKGASWSFPRGKINKDEKDIDCAVREVYEETGFDLRAHGLVQTNENNGEVKAIDITMKDQHLKMFVFRGVSLQTHFEPRTRKEISGIQWYDIKDLPGFKKLPKGQTLKLQGHSSKFYMVAPFLPALKKWINVQRHIDAANNTGIADHYISDAVLGYSEGPTIDPDSYTRQVAPQAEYASADHLKQLLSIAQAPQPYQVLNHGQTQPNTSGDDLMAMLRRAQAPMQEPTSWTNQTHYQLPQPIQGQSQTLQSHTPAQNSQAHQYPPNDPILGQSSRAIYTPAAQNPYPTNLSGATAQQYDLASQERMPSTIDTHAQFMLQPTQAASAPAQPLPDGHQKALLHSFLTNAQSTKEHPYSAQVHSTALLSADSAYGKTDSGPPVPDASQLPAPKLSAHSARLLDAFKAPSAKTIAAPLPQAGTSKKIAQQNALLDLFKPSVPSAVPAQLPDQIKPADPSQLMLGGAPSLLQPNKKAERKVTLGEITRTLAPRTKTASPNPKSVLSKTIAMRPHAKTAGVESQALSQSTNGTDSVDIVPHGNHMAKAPQPAIKSLEQAATKSKSREDNAYIDRPKSRGLLFDPKAPVKSPQLSAQPRSSSNGQAIAQPEHPSRSRQSSKTQQQTHQKQVSTGKPVVVPVPQYSILSRPGSSAGYNLSSTPASPSPLRKEEIPPVISDHPQVLKRASSNVEKDTALAMSEATPPAESQKDQLLALFGKSQVPKHVDPLPRPIASGKDALLDLFTSRKQPAPPDNAPRVQEPPAAPQLLPEKSSSRVQSVTPGLAIEPKPKPTTQQDLLSLFRRPSDPRASTPGTPISPFALGTPVTLFKSQGVLPSREIPSAIAAPPTTTPAETKGTLLDYLNGVVQKEGRTR